MHDLPDEPACTSDEQPLPENPNRFFLLALGFETGLVVVALASGAIFGVNPLATWHWRCIDVGWGLLATLPLLAGLWVADRYPFGSLIALRRLVHELIVPLFRGLKLWQLAAISLAAGVGEEILFRGFLQAGIATLLSRWVAPAATLWTALLLTSVLFGLAHFISRTYALLCFAVGVYLGALWLGTGNLLVPVVVHGLYDFVALVWLVHCSAASEKSGDS